MRVPDNDFAEVEQAGLRSVALRGRHRALARSHAAGAPLRLRRRASVPPEHQPHASLRERAEGRVGRCDQLRAGRLHPLRREEGREKNYEPNSFNEPVRLFRAVAQPLAGVDALQRLTLAVHAFDCHAAGVRLSGIDEFSGACHAVLFARHRPGDFVPVDFVVAHLAVGRIRIAPRSEVSPSRDRRLLLW